MNDETKTNPADATHPPPKPVKQEEQEIELPKFEKAMADKITAKFGDKTEIAFVKENRIKVNTKKDDIKQVAEFINKELNFDHAESVTGVDYPQDNEIEVVYHLGSYSDPSLAKQILTLTTRATREQDPNPGNDSTRLPSLRDIFYSVEFHERECFEMLGVYFEGHPDNRRLLLPEDWADLPPLRKDFKIKGR
jgi:NADH-quinone oxidoreductase subunit C